jgi:hypothetical protein
MEEFHLEKINKPLIPNKFARWILGGFGAVQILATVVMDVFFETEIDYTGISSWYLVTALLMFVMPIIRFKSAHPMFVHITRNGFHSCLYESSEYLMQEQGKQFEFETDWDEVDQVEIHALKLVFHFKNNATEIVYFGHLKYKQIQELKAALRDALKTNTIPLSEGIQANMITA